MNDRRRSKRTGIEASLVIKRLDGAVTQDVEIALADLSRSGVGFYSKEPLNIGAIYESFLTIWTKEVIHCFLQIVRIELEGDVFAYGAIFIGMPEMDAARIGVYQTINDPDEK